MQPGSLVTLPLERAIPAAGKAKLQVYAVVLNTLPDSTYVEVLWCNGGHAGKIARVHSRWFEEVNKE